MIWRPIPTFEGRYEVGDTGEVRNARNGYVLSPRPDSDGYMMVTLWSPEKEDRKVHRLVLEAFVGPAPTAVPEADHINGYRSDNRLANLRWASVSLNRRNLHCPVKGASGVRGVRFRPDRPNPWQAYARQDGRFTSLGHFSNIDAASAARTAFERQALA